MLKKEKGRTATHMVYLSTNRRVLILLLERLGYPDTEMLCYVQGYPVRSGEALHPW